MNLDEIVYSLQNLRSRRMRSWLTVLSILIGVAAIFAIVSFGLGLREYMNVLAAEAGTDKLFIQAKGIGAPGTDDNFFISKSDIDFVGKIKGVDEIEGYYMKVAEIEFKKEKRFRFAAGIDPEKKQLNDEAFTVIIEKGRDLKKGETSKITLGYLYQFDNGVFRKGISVGDNVELNGEKLEVVGFYEEIGNPSDDSNIYLTYAGMEALYDDIKDKFGWVIIRAEKGADPEELAGKIEEKLRKHKGQEEGKEDFYVQTFADALATFGSILDVLNGILLLIALISLIVASVNIMNTMYTAVLERTNEIGIMKAIGARKSDIMFIFLFESGFLGAVGGVLGVIFGWAIASAGGSIAAAAGYSFLKPVFPWYLILGCILFAFFVGAIAGLLPSIQAAKLKPVDALRYE